jgi:hypothetical protein
MDPRNLFDECTLIFVWLHIWAFRLKWTQAKLKLGRWVWVWHDCELRRPRLPFSSHELFTAKLFEQHHARVIPIYSVVLLRSEGIDDDSCRRTLYQTYTGLHERANGNTPWKSPESYLLIIYIVSNLQGFPGQDAVAQQMQAKSLKQPPMLKSFHRFLILWRTPISSSKKIWK